MLSTHYRQPINWSQRKLEEAAATLSTFRTRCFDDGTDRVSEEVLEALLDDMNTPAAVAELHRLFHESQKGKVSSSVVRSTCRFLGINVDEADLERMTLTPVEIDRAKVEALIEERTLARKVKNFAEADRIRDELAGMGIAIKDSRDGTIWEVAR